MLPTLVGWSFVAAIAGLFVMVALAIHAAFNLVERRAARDTYLDNKPELSEPTEL